MSPASPIEPVRMNCRSPSLDPAAKSLETTSGRLAVDPERVAGRAGAFRHVVERRLAGLGPDEGAPRKSCGKR